MKLERSQVPSAGFVVGGSAIILVTIATSADPANWLQNLSRPSFWFHVLIYVVAPLLGVVTLAWLARLAFVLTRATLAMRRLPSALQPDARLAMAIARTGARRVRCIEGSVPIAFCAGAVRPEIVVSDGLAEQLDDDQLAAVLLHEHHHLREREPMIRVASEAAAQVLFFFPIARWWSRRRIERAELRADRAAVSAVGPRPVAAALCLLGSAMPAQAAFAGAAEVRVAQLLGDPLPSRRPAASTIAASLLGFPFAIVLAGCLMHEFGKLFLGG
jgi:Zn-dependent protease with chaperone function